MKYTKISIITPVYNQVNFLEETILSVIGQEYPNLEYIIIDGGSTDGSLDIIKQHESSLTYWVSEPDKGMYDALNKGFKVSTGEIMGWINSDDLLFKNTLASLAKLFNDLSDVKWIQGMNGFINEQSELVKIEKPKKFSLLKFLDHDFKWIQQESTFWKRELWEVAGSKIDEDLKLAGDFELWFRFFQAEKLYNCQLTFGAWRKRKGQLSGTQMHKYLDEVFAVINSYELNADEAKTLNKIRRLNTLIKLCQKTKVLNTKILENKRNKLLNLNGVDITYSNHNNAFIIN